METEKKPRKPPKRLDPKAVEALEKLFEVNMYLTSEKKEEVAEQLGLEPSSVSKWFINRRAKMRTMGQAPNASQTQTFTSGKGIPNRVEIAPKYEINFAPLTEPISKKLKVEEEGRRFHEEKEEEGFWKMWRKRNQIPIRSDFEEFPDAFEDDQGLDPSVESFHQQYINVFDGRKILVPKERAFFHCLPLWKQLFLLRSRIPELMNMQSQKIAKQIELRLELLADLRKQQNAPLEFALLRGPSLMSPFIVEELNTTLGRHSMKHRISDVAVGNDNRISHVHAILKWQPSSGSWKVVNSSKNGLRVMDATHHWTVLNRLGESCDLSSPAVLWFAQTPVYFQRFALTEAAVVSEPSTGISLAPSRPNSVAGPLTLVQLIEYTLECIPEHSATYSQICAFISEHFPDEVAHRPRWKSSLSSALSGSSLFIGGSALSQKKARSVGSQWYLRKYFPDLVPVSKQNSNSVG